MEDYGKKTTTVLEVAWEFYMISLMFLISLSDEKYIVVSLIDKNFISSKILAKYSKVLLDNVAA